MPKLNITHIVERLQLRLQQLERGQALAARDINALLTDEQQNELKTAWAAQQAMRKKYIQPKTVAEIQAIGWKTIREVRIEVLKRALKEAQDGLVDGIEQLQRQSEVKASKIFLDTYYNAKDENKNAFSAANIALTRSGYNKVNATNSKFVSKRDKLVNELEEVLLKKFDKLEDEV
jgi:hypothetical protein